MKEIVYDSFKTTLKEVQFLSNIIKKEKASKDELQKGLTKARDLLFSSYSSLNILDEAVTNYVSAGYKMVFLEGNKKKKISKAEAKVIYSKLINLIKIELEEGIINPRTKIHSENELFLLFGITFYSAQVSEEIKEIDKTLKIAELNKNESKNIFLKYYNDVIKFIEDILLYGVFLIFDKPKVTVENGLLDLRPNRKKEYIQKWVDGTVEYMDIFRNKRTDHWAEIYNLKLGGEKIEDIEKLQIKLFNEFIKNTVDSEIEDIQELETSNKNELIKNHKELIENFFKGDTSKITIKRLKNIFGFSKSKEVLLEYDNLLRDKLILSDFIIYERGKSTYSTTFVAGFFMKYLDELKILSSTKRDTVSLLQKKENTFKTVITNKSKREYIYNILEHFGAINSERKSVLTERKKGVLRGVVEALMDNNILPQLGLHNLCIIIAKEINLELKSKLDYHDTAKNVHKEAKEYIKENPFN
ncbi:hypothetical protein [Polaribacter sp. IC073]|uniref:hypothetical protein n=1 Tax=Polaribacter sp. IC073 TaxID=2508540 RepID=UPI0011BFB0A9|nr:hypothetical protein [Polaribacter sp. IC073]TXD45852.1 hypothetical protein ES045_15925 [Polaribacter sp. IC073]